MKFLQAAVLSVIFMGYVTASHLYYVGYDGLHRAIDEGRWDIAVDLVKQDETLGKAGVEYVIRKRDPYLIASFVNQTRQANASTLYKLWSESPREIFEKVLEKVDFPQQALVDLASSHQVDYYPEKFLVQLNKIVKPEDQEKVVEKGIGQVVGEYSDTSPLLNAFRGRTFRSKRLEDIAVQEAFMHGVRRGRVDLLPKDICEHAAITPELYADALIETADWWIGNAMHQFLLKNADRYDLEAVKEKEGYADLNHWFRDDIEEALKAAAPGGTRQHKYLVQSAKIAKQIIGEITKTRTPLPTKDIGDILGAYLGEDEE